MIQFCQYANIIPSPLSSFFYWQFTWDRPISLFFCLGCLCCSKETMLPYYLDQGLLTVSSCSTTPILFPIMRLQRKMNITSFWHYEQYWRRIWYVDPSDVSVSVCVLVHYLLKEIKIETFTGYDSKSSAEKLSPTFSL